MTVRIEIIADDGVRAAAELKQMADGLAIMGLVQNQVSAGLVPAPAPAAPAEVAEETTDKPATATDKKAAAAAKRAATAKAKKEAKAAEEAAKVETEDTTTEASDETPAENPDPYRLFDEDGKEDELFDTADQFKVALVSMLTDAPDEMTLAAVGKANEETMQRLQAEDVDFDDVLTAYKTAGEKFAAAKADVVELGGEAAQAAAEETAAEESKSDDGDPATLDDVKGAIKKLSADKGVKTCMEVMQKFGATKASELKDEDRAAFVKACDEAAA